MTLEVYYDRVTANKYAATSGAVNRKLRTSGAHHYYEIYDQNTDIYNYQNYYDYDDINIGQHTIIDDVVIGLEFPCRPLVTVSAKTGKKFKFRTR